LPFAVRSRISAPFTRPAETGLPWRVFSHAALAAAALLMAEIEMPKMKTKSGAKKRFRFTGTGKIIATQAGKRHGMIKRTNKTIRNQRGTTIMSESDAGLVRQYMRYGGR
jgi:large subunit ribosomal protein L35